MSQQPSDPQPFLVRFDAARDSFLAAFAQAPDETLSYVPMGDEYALGVLLPHLDDSMMGYLRLLGLIEAANFGQVDRGSDTAGQLAAKERHEALVQMRPTAEDRASLLANLATAHESVRARIAELDAETFTRQAPVIYSAGSAPYPTSARDIIGWLTDHYDEHTAQLGKMLAQWQEERRP